MSGDSQHKVAVIISADGRELSKVAVDAVKQVEGLGVAAVKAAGQTKGATGDITTMLSQLSQQQIQQQAVVDEMRGTSARRWVAEQKSATDQVEKTHKSAADKSTEPWLDWAAKSGMAIYAWRTNIEFALNAASGAFDFAKQIAELARLNDNFKRTATLAGYWADGLVMASRKATGDTVSNAQVQANTMKAINQGLFASQDQLVKLWEIAKFKSETIGGETGQIFEQMTTGIVRNTQRSAKMLNVSFGLDIPAAFDKTNEALTQTERQMELTKTVIENASQQMDKFGESGDSAARVCERTTANLENLKQGLIGAASAVGSLIGKFGGLFDLMNSKEGREALDIALRAMPGLLGTIPRLVLGAYGAATGQQDRNPYAGMSPADLGAESTRIQSDKGLQGKNLDAALAQYKSLLGSAPSQEAVEKSSQRVLAVQTALNETLAKEEQLRAALVDKQNQMVGAVDREAKATGKINEERGEKAAEEAKKAGEKAASALQKARDAFFKELTSDLEHGITGGSMSGKTMGGVADAGAMAGLSFGAGSVMPQLFNKTNAEQLKKQGEITERDLEQHARDLTERLVREQPLSVIIFGLNAGAKMTSLAPLDTKPWADQVASTIDGLVPVIGDNLAAGFKSMLDTARNSSPFAAFALKAMGLDGEASSAAAFFSPTSVMMQVMGSAGGTPGFGIRSDKTDPKNTTDKSGVTAWDKEVKAALDQYKEKMKVNTRDAFESGLYDAMNGGNFFESFGNALKQQVTKSLAAGITQQIFGSSTGILNLGSLFGQSTSPGASSSSGGGGFLGGIVDKIGSLFGAKQAAGAAAGGGFNLAGMAGGLAIGAGLSWLTSPGNLLGGTVIHGQEAQGQAADINARVTQAQTDRDQLYTTLIGVSQATLDAIKNTTFWTAGVTANHSGNGITSRNTTTYALDATAANASLSSFETLKAQATGEALAREFAKTMAGLDDPTRALAMTISDLQELLTRTPGGTQTYFQTLTSLTQAQNAQKQQDWARSGTMIGQLSGNPMSGITADNVFYKPRTGFSGLMDSAVRQYPGIGQMTRTQQSDMIDLYSQMPGMVRSSDYAISVAQAGADPKKQQALLAQQRDALVGQATELKKVVDELAREIPNITDVTEAKAKFQEWQTALEGYTAARTSAIQADAQLAASAAAELDARQSGARQSLMGSVGMWDYRTKIGYQTPVHQETGSGSSRVSVRPMVVAPGATATNYVDASAVQRALLTGIITPEVRKAADTLYGGDLDLLGGLSSAALSQAGIAKNSSFARANITAGNSQLAQRGVKNDQETYFKRQITDLQGMIDDAYNIILHPKDKAAQDAARQTYLQGIQQQSDLQTQVMQMDADRTTESQDIIRNRQQSYLSMALNNPYSATAQSRETIDAATGRQPTTYGSGAYGMVRADTQNLSTSDWAQQILKNQPVDILTQMKTSKENMLGALASDKMRLDATGDEGKTQEYLKKRDTDLATQAATAQQLMDDAEARVQAAKDDIKAATQASQDYAQAQQAYYQAEEDRMNTEAELQAKAKAQKESMTQDLIGTFLTRIGETSKNAAGQTVVVMSPGQPSAKKLAQQILDSVAGAEPELATALKYFIDKVA